MNPIVSVVSVVAVLLFFLAILLAGFGLRKTEDSYFSGISTNLTSERLFFLAGSLPLLIPLLLFLKNYSPNSNSNYLIIGYAGIPILIAYLVLYRYSGNRLPDSTSHSDAFENSSIYNAYLILANNGLKLPILVYTYALIMETLYGDVSFKIIIAIMTISGLLLMFHGRSAFIHSGIIIGAALLISMFILASIEITGDNLVGVDSLLMAPNIAGPAMNPLWYVPLSLILAGILIGDLKFTANTLNRPLATKNRRNNISFTVLLFVYLLFMSVAFQGQVDLFFRAGVARSTVLNGLHFNGFILIILSGLLIIGLMSVYQSTSQIVAHQIFRKYRKNAGNGILILVSRLTIALSVAIAILLTLLAPFITVPILNILLTIYIGFSIPVLAVYLYSLIEPNLESKKIGYSLIVGWLPGIMIAIFTLSDNTNHIHLLWFLSFYLLYNCLCVYLIHIINSSVELMFPE